jgi:tRNA-dihydrouridine synthase
MLGRGAIRNPWVFEQIRAAVAGREVSYPTGREVLRYVERLFEVATDEGYREEERVHRVKKHLNFLGVGVPPSAEFLHRMRRARAKDELFAICAAYLDHEKPMPLVGESDKG